MKTRHHIRHGQYYSSNAEAQVAQDRFQRFCLRYGYKLLVDRIAAHEKHWLYQGSGEKEVEI